MAEEQTPVERAEEAVCDEIVTRAKDTATNTEHAEEIGKLAHAVAELKHGPQGGAYSHVYEGRYSSTADNHSTDHQGEQRPRPEPGFG